MDSTAVNMAGKDGGNAFGYPEGRLYVMNAELEILGVKLKHYRVDAAMEIAEEYLTNDKLNTIGIVTMQMLMQASNDPTWKQAIEDLDLTVIGETEVLEAAGIDPEMPSYEEVETNEFIARFYWATRRRNCRRCRNI